MSIAEIMAKKFVLVRWVGEETLSVLLSSAAHPSHSLYVGAFAELKWGGKFYEGEILKLSG